MVKKKDCIEFKADWETIYQYIERGLHRMCGSLYKYPLACEFNGGEFIITKDSTMDSCYTAWQADMNKKAEEYHKSPEYVEYQRKQEEKSKKMNNEVLILFDTFEKLPFQSRTQDSMLKILNWLADYQPYSDSILCTDKNDNYVIQTLEKYGFVENANVGQKEYTDEECFVYIVGQAISTMKLVALHHMVVLFRDRWIKDYVN